MFLDNRRDINLAKIHSIKHFIRFRSTYCGKPSIEAALVDSKLQVVDVTTPGEFRSLTVKPHPSTINIPIDELHLKLGEISWEKDIPLVFYCKHGVRSGIAAKLAEQAGFKNVHSVENEEAVRNLLKYAESVKNSKK
jgi:phage shock protein E